jgi:hypothetical protein
MSAFDPERRFAIANYRTLFDNLVGRGGAAVAQQAQSSAIIA